MEEVAELLWRMLWPYVREVLSEVLIGAADLNEATIEALAELVCFKTERRVREIVRELNQLAREGEFEELRRLIRENPELARKASRYVATRFKRRIRMILAELREKREEMNG